MISKKLLYSGALGGGYIMLLQNCTIWFFNIFFIFTGQCTLVHMRGLGIACRPSVCLSVRPSVCDIGGL